MKLFLENKQLFTRSMWRCQLELVYVGSTTMACIGSESMQCEAMYRIRRTRHPLFVSFAQSPIVSRQSVIKEWLFLCTASDRNSRKYREISTNFPQPPVRALPPRTASSDKVTVQSESTKLRTQRTTVFRYIQMKSDKLRLISS